MIQNLTSLAWGIAVFAIIVAVAMVVLVKFGNSVGGTANTTINTVIGYLGTSNGLASWLPAIIALTIGLVFIGALAFKKGGF